MLVVITIIGLLAAVALPNLPGMTHANSMTTATQQLLGDCALARQLAVSHRSTVYMVFAPPYSAALSRPINQSNSYNNLMVEPLKTAEAGSTSTPHHQKLQLESSR